MSFRLRIEATRQLQWLSCVYVRRITCQPEIQYLTIEFFKGKLVGLITHQVDFLFLPNSLNPNISYSATRTVLLI